MGVTRFTTPTFTLTFTEESLDLTNAANVYVTFSSAGASFTKTGEDLEIAEKEIDIYLSQEETGKLEDQVFIQANWTTETGDRAASDIVAVDIDPQLLRKVVE